MSFSLWKEYHFTCDVCGFCNMTPPDNRRSEEVILTPFDCDNKREAWKILKSAGWVFVSGKHLCSVCAKEKTNE